jgi:hypothetical protein
MSTLDWGFNTKNKPAGSAKACPELLLLEHNKKVIA